MIIVAYEYNPTIFMVINHHVLANLDVRAGWACVKLTHLLCECGRRIVNVEVLFEKF